MRSCLGDSSSSAQVNVRVGGGLIAGDFFPLPESQVKHNMK